MQEAGGTYQHLQHHGGVMIGFLRIVEPEEQHLVENVKSTLEVVQPKPLRTIGVDFHRSHLLYNRSFQVCWHLWIEVDQTVDYVYKVRRFNFVGSLAI